MRKSILCIVLVVLLGCSNNNPTENNKIKKVDKVQQHTEPSIGNKVSIVEKGIPIDTLRAGFPKIGELLDSIMMTIEKHDWNSFLSYCDIEVVEVQASTDITKKQYIFEILNLIMQSESDNLENINLILSQVKSAEILSYTHDMGIQEAFFQFYGIIKTNELGTFDFWFELRINEKDAKIIGVGD